MTAWLDHPAAQAGVLPFMVALVLALLLARTRYLRPQPSAGWRCCST